jgi:polynucleotide 5'-hydroxyl-kinase GRC3/NOL9
MDMPGPAVGLHRVFPDGKSAFGIPGCHPVLRQAASPVYRYVTPPSWEDALRRIGQQAGEETEEGEGEGDRLGEFVALVKGAKRSGKSTFARELVNRLLGS